MSKFFQMFATPPMMEVEYEGSLDSFKRGSEQLTYRDSFANSVSTNTYVYGRMYMHVYIVYCAEIRDPLPFIVILFRKIEQFGNSA